MPTSTKIVFLQSLPAAILGGVWAYLSPILDISTWISFITWATYFLVVSMPGYTKPQDAFIKYSLSLVVGICFGMTLATVQPQLADLTNPVVAMPLLIPLTVIVMSQLARVSWIPFVPGFFVGSSLFFGAQLNVSWSSFFSMAIACVCGTILGLVTVLINNRLNQKLTIAEAPIHKKAS